MLSFNNYKNISMFALACGLLFLVLLLARNYHELLFISNRVQEDITSSDSKQWNTTSYNADPLLPGTSPIYVLASDGFVIERWKPIAGYLDASDFKHLLAFNQIQTIQTSSQQDWRVFSLPIENNGHAHGVVTVSSYHQTPEMVMVYDEQMVTAANYVLEHVTVENNQVVVKNLEQRNIPHYISFQVVNEFNTIVTKGNNNNSIDRLPNFIDPSYIAAELKTLNTKVKSDSKTGEIYLLYSQPLLDDAKNAKGVIVVGKNLSPLLVSFFTYLVVVGVLLGLHGLYTFTKKMFKEQQKKTLKIFIRFDEKNSVILVNQDKIPIAYASNQYYLCLATINHPTKRWEVDELLDKFGVEMQAGSWRKIYDAMNQVNKKAKPILGKKLILLEEKTYRLNPDLM